MNEDSTVKPMGVSYFQQTMQQFFYPQSRGFNVFPPPQDHNCLLSSMPTPLPRQSLVTPNSMFGSTIIDYQWGFLLENTLFTAFDLHNQWLLESFYRQLNCNQTKWIEITDSHLSDKARVYFGVASKHLRMPGTRYNVIRQRIMGGNIV